MRMVDRVFFVPNNLISEAHLDQPLKFGNVHLSAPHMYASILECLSLTPNHSEGVSFLNIGSGSGYLSCMVAWVLGQKSWDLQYGVELFEDVIEHCMVSVSSWKNHTPTGSYVNLKLSHGNGLSILPNEGQGRVGFDRIYVGATISFQDLSKVMPLLSPGGILVCPCVDCLIKVTRLANGSRDGFERKVISCVRFAPALTEPDKKVILPAQVWNPNSHKGYPAAFKGCIQAILLCSNAKFIPSSEKILYCNSACLISNDLWLVVFSFMDRAWFVDTHQFSEDDCAMSLLDNVGPISIMTVNTTIDNWLLHDNSMINQNFHLYDSDFQYDSESQQSNEDMDEDDYGVIASAIANFPVGQPREPVLIASVGSSSVPSGTATSHRTVSLGEREL